MEGNYEDEKTSIKEQMEKGKCSFLEALKCFHIRTQKSKNETVFNPTLITISV